MVQELSKRVTAAMQDAHAKSVAVGGGQRHTMCIGRCLHVAADFLKPQILLSRRGMLVVLAGHEAEDAVAGQDTRDPQPRAVELVSTGVAQGL